MSASFKVLSLLSLSLMALLTAPQAGAISHKTAREFSGFKDYQDYLHMLPDSGVYAERLALQRRMSESCGKEPGLKLYASEYSKFGRLSGSSLLAEQERKNAFDLMSRLDPERYGMADPASTDCTEASRRMAAANMEYQARLLFPDSAVNSSSVSKVLPTEVATSDSAGEGSSAGTAR